VWCGVTKGNVHAQIEALLLVMVSMALGFPIHGVMKVKVLC
jgi:hypothetical protein